jgi:uncharacterized protein
MELVNEFIVNRPIEEAWAIITDVERIAPCLPGAELQEIEGEVYRGLVKVKVGPISASLKGQAIFLERDDVNHRAVLKGDGRDASKGNASAIITATLEQQTPTSSICKVHTDLTMTGKVAQFGRGALADVSTKLMVQFSQNLDEMLANDANSAPAEATAAAPQAPTAVAADASATVQAAAEPQAAPTVRKIHGPAAEPIDALSLGGNAMFKRLLPVAGGLVAILLLLLRRSRK